MIARTNGNGYLTVSQASSVFGLSTVTIRKIVDRTEGLCFCSTGGHRRINQKALADHLGITRDNGLVKTTTPIGMVCRCSGGHQNKKSGPQAEASSLDHQIKRVEDFTRERFGEQALASAVRYFRIGSGLAHNHPILVKLVSDILSGKFKGGYIVAQDSLRVMRFGNEMFSQICKFGECEILYVMEPEKDDAESDLTNSILGIITHFTAKASGLRAKKILEIKLSETDLVTLHKLYRSGMTFVQLEAYCTQHSIAGTNGKTLKANTIRKILLRTRKVLDQLVEDDKNTFQLFVDSNILVDSNGSGSMLRSELYEAYARWCQDNNQAPLTIIKMSTYIRKVLNWRTGLVPEKAVLKYVGVALRSN